MSNYVGAAASFAVGVGLLAAVVIFTPEDFPLDPLLIIAAVGAFSMGLSELGVKEAAKK